MPVWCVLSDGGMTIEITDGGFSWQENNYSGHGDSSVQITSEVNDMPERGAGTLQLSGINLQVFKVSRSFNYVLNDKQFLHSFY